MGLFSKLFNTPSRMARRQVTRRESLSARPMQNPNVRTEKRGNSLLLRVPLKKPSSSLLSNTLFRVPPERKVVLDSIGTWVWQQCDQERTVEEIIELTRLHYKFSHKEALISVTTFLKQLASKGIIAFVVPKDVAETVKQS